MDTGDPKPLEDALAKLKSKANTEAYASTLLAYAAKRRGDVATARTLFKSAVYVPEWNVIGPFDDEGEGGLSKTFGPEITGLSDVPIPSKERAVSRRGPTRQGSKQARRLTARRK